MDSSYSNSPRGKFEGRTMFFKNITKGRNSSVSSQCLLDDVSEGDFAGVTLVWTPATPEPEVPGGSSWSFLPPAQIQTGRHPTIVNFTSCTSTFILVVVVVIALILLAEFYFWVRKDIHRQLRNVN